MLSALHTAIEALPRLLASSSEWQSVHVTYHPPRVERLWIQHGENRIFLHRIHPCAPDDALWHPHPWPSAVRIVAGRYDHGVSIRAADGEASRDPRMLVRTILSPGSEYEMTEPDAWHVVRPLDEPVDSIMVTGAPYSPRVAMPSPPSTPQGPLTADRVEELREVWLQRLR